MTILTQGLRRQRFRISAFTDPNLALEHFQFGYDEYDLVISDLRMPQINGLEFIKKVKDIKPTIKVFFMTAFEIDANEWSNVLPSIKIVEFI